MATSGTTPGAAADQQHRGGVVAVPDEPAADRAAQLELVADVGDGGQVRRHLAVVDADDGQLEAVGPGGDAIE